MEHNLMTVGQVAAKLGCGQSTIWRWVAENQFCDPIRINGTTRWHPNDVEGFIAEQRGASARISFPKSQTKKKVKPRRSKDGGIRTNKSGKK